MKDNVQVSKNFSTKSAALGFMSFLDKPEMLLKVVGDSFAVVYVTERSIVDGEVINDGDDPIITS